MKKHLKLTDEQQSMIDAAITEAREELSKELKQEEPISESQVARVQEGIKSHNEVVKSFTDWRRIHRCRGRVHPYPPRFYQ